MASCLAWASGGRATCLPWALVAKHGAQQSRSRRGNCYDKAHAESFWSRFKAELLDGGSFPGLAEAKLEISHYIAYYNAERRHSALGYQAPTTSKPIFKQRPNSVWLSLGHLMQPLRKTCLPRQAVEIIPTQPTHSTPLKRIYPLLLKGFSTNFSASSPSKNEDFDLTRPCL